MNHFPTRRVLITGARILTVMAVVVACTTAPRRNPSTSTTTGLGRAGGPAVVGFGPPSLNGVNRLTNAPAGCNVTEGQAVTCTITISPAAPAGASFTFALTPRITGAGAWTVRDANNRPGGGTGADIMATNGGTIQCVFVPTGATSVTFPITVVDDNVAELDETIAATITGATNLTIGTSTTTITILDNDRSGTYNPVDYGATLNNSADDDAPGIQAAINAAMGGATGTAGGARGVVVFPAGQFDVFGSDPNGMTPIMLIPANGGITLSGYGSGGSRVRVKSGGCIGARRSTDPAGANVCAHRMFNVSPFSDYRGSGGWDSPSDSAPIVFQGLDLDGNRDGNIGPYRNYASEQSHTIFLSGKSGSINTGKYVSFVQDVNTKNSPADGVSIFTNSRHAQWNTTHHDDFRGGFVATGGGAIWKVDGITTTSTSYAKTGIDIEIDGIAQLGNGTNGHANNYWDMSMTGDLKNADIDGDLDIGSFLTNDANRCYSTPSLCGTGSQQTYDNVTMRAGFLTLQSTGGLDTLLVTNSTLRAGVRDSEINRFVYANGIMKFQNTNLIVDNAPTSNGSNGGQGLDIYWALGGYHPPTPATVEFQNVTATIDNTTYGAPPAPCILNQISKYAGATLNIKDSNLGSGWTCAANGIVGSATITGGTTGATPTTTTTLPSAQRACDGSPPPTTVPGATTTTVTPTTVGPTTTVGPYTNRVEVEGCTKGADVITGGGAVYGNNSVGASTNVTCSFTNSGAAGTKVMTIRYDSPSAYIRQVIVNGTSYPASPGLQYANTGGSFSTITNSVPLLAGANTIVFNVSYFTMDWFEFDSTTAPVTTVPATTTTTTTTTPAATTTVVPATCQRREAETTPTLVNWLVNNTISGASGGSYVGDTNFTGSVTYTITVATAGDYQLRTQSQTGGSGATRFVTVNGTFSSNMVWSAQPAWSLALLPTITLNAGANTIKIEQLAVDNGIRGSLYIDYIDLCATGTVTTTITGTTVPTRTLTLNAFRDVNRNGIREVTEGSMAGAVWRVRNSGAVVVAGGTIGSTGTVTATVATGAGFTVTLTPPAGQGATTAIVGNIPASGAFIFTVGGCCPRPVR